MYNLTPFIVLCRRSAETIYLSAHDEVISLCVELTEHVKVLESKFEEPSCISERSAVADPAKSAAAAHRLEYFWQGYRVSTLLYCSRTFGTLYRNITLCTCIGMGTLSIDQLIKL